MFFEVRDTVEEVDAYGGGVEVGAGEDAGDVVGTTEEVDGVFDECGKNGCERRVAADHVVDGERGEVVVECVAVVVGRDVVFVDEAGWVVVSVDWGGVVAVLGEPCGGVAWRGVVLEVFDGVCGEFGRGAVVEIAWHIGWWDSRDCETGDPDRRCSESSTEPPQS